MTTDRTTDKTAAAPRPTLPAQPTLANLTSEQRAALQRRTLRVLMTSQMAGSAGVSVAVTVGGPIVKTILGGDTFAGAASASVTLGGATAGLLLSALMRRRGRRPGLLRGYIVAMAGGVVTIVGAEQRWLPLFLFGLVFFGVGQGTNLLARYAAADLALPDQRSRAISLLLFGSTFGAVAAQVLVGWCEDMAERVGLWRYSGPFVFAVVLLVLAALNTGIRLRPDPLVVAGGVTPDDPGPRIPPISPALQIIRAHSMAKLALASMMISQAAMVAVMTMTPIHMKDHGHSGQLTGYVIALHICGMYMFAPFVGRLADSWGRVQVILSGACVLLAGTLVSAIAGPKPSVLFLGLFLIGLGWSGGMIGGTSLLVESIPPSDRVTVQGAADLLMSLCGGLAGFASGFVKRALGYHMLSNLGSVAALTLLIVALRAFRSTAAPAPA